MRTAMTVRVFSGRVGRLVLPVATAAAIGVAAGPAQANRPITASHLSGSRAVDSVPAARHAAASVRLDRRPLGRKVG